MSEQARKLLASALALPVPERAKLVTALLASLGDEPSEDVELAWTEEVMRRAKEGGDEDASWEDVRAELRSAR
ncbi:MAG: addiction module protein [Sandaracinus sp.]|nr:addiction module protein [Sandaracinus sp.]MCB9624111.1 addiction module protein [Sandaracinus sp.]